MIDKTKDLVECGHKIFLELRNVKRFSSIILNAVVNFCKRRTTFIFTGVLCSVFALPGHAQLVINNPSFEDKPREAAVPSDWMACSKKTTPDILPGEFDVETSPAEGNTYVGLITREVGEQEVIAQKLDFVLKENQCYEFSFDVARSDTYASYNIPVGLKIWISSASCVSQQLIYHAKKIESTDWVQTRVRFTPVEDMRYIKISPVPASGLYFDYNGNVLLDNISVFNMCSRT